MEGDLAQRLARLRRNSFGVEDDPDSDVGAGDPVQPDSLGQNDPSISDTFVRRGNHGAYRVSSQDDCSVCADCERRHGARGEGPRAFCSHRSDSGSGLDASTSDFSFIAPRGRAVIGARDDEDDNDCNNDGDELEWFGCEQVEDAVPVAVPSHSFHLS